MSRVEIRSVENGPNMIFVDGKAFTAVCRCGASGNMPYCNGSHRTVGFDARPAELKVLND